LVIPSLKVWETANGFSFPLAFNRRDLTSLGFDKVLVAAFTNEQCMFPLFSIRKLHPVIYWELL
jgi:hypothetical protein